MTVVKLGKWALRTALVGYQIRGAVVDSINLFPPRGHP